MKQILVGLLVFFLFVNVASAQQRELSNWLENFRTNLLELLTTLEATEEGNVHSEEVLSRESAEANVSDSSDRLEVLLEREADRLGPDEAELRCPAFYGSELETGSTGPEVEKLQTFLATKYPEAALRTSGVYDAETTTLIQRYQTENGIVSAGSPATTGFGLFGPRTRLAIAQACREEVTNPEIVRIEGICMTNAPCASIRPKGKVSGRINFYNPIGDADVGEYVVVEGFYTTEKRSSYHGDDFRVQRVISRTTVMEIEPGFGGNIQFWVPESDPDLLNIITTVVDCEPFQLQIHLTDGSVRALETDTGLGLRSCIEVNEAGEVVFSNNTEPVPVARYYSFRPAQAVHAVYLEFDEDQFVSEE